MSRESHCLYPEFLSSQSKLPSHVVVSPPLTYPGNQIAASFGHCGFRVAIDDLHDLEV